jgi:hypothetical protein
MHCVIDSATRQHAHDEGNIQEEEEFAHLKVKELTSKGGEFYPFTVDHWQHATGELSESMSGFMVKLAEENSDALLGRLWIANIRAFWESQAYQYVERQMGNKKLGKGNE